MICHICKIKVDQVYKVIKNIRIYECRICKLGFLGRQLKIKQSHIKKSTLYDIRAYKKQETKLRNRFEQLFKIISQFKKQGDVLDVGAGFGLFSSILNAKGDFKIFTIEPKQNLIFIKSLKFINYKTTFERFKINNKKYDIILMMDVLEHFKNPINNLKKAKSLLKQNGILVIQTPNYKSFMANICIDWAWWMVEDHKFFFSPKSLRKTLDKVNLKTEYFKTYEDWEDFKKNLDGNFVRIKNTIFRKVTKGIFFSIFFPLYFTFRKILWFLGGGGLIFLIARKN